VHIGRIDSYWQVSKMEIKETKRNTKPKSEKAESEKAETGIQRQAAIDEGIDRGLRGWRGYGIFKSV